MTLTEAQNAMLRGQKLGDVYPAVAEADRPALKDFFCKHPELPLHREPAAGKPGPIPGRDETRRLAIGQAKTLGYTGNPCGQCGSLMVTRNGACEKCESCGATTGCS